MCAVIHFNYSPNSSPIDCNAHMHTDFHKKRVKILREYALMLFDDEKPNKRFVKGLN